MQQADRVTEAYDTPLTCDRLALCGQKFVVKFTVNLPFASATYADAPKAIKFEDDPEHVVVLPQMVEAVCPSAAFG